MIQLSRKFLEETQADVIGYGAKDTGEMGGGAASSVLKTGGAEILAALKRELPKTTHQVGDVVLTDSFGLKKHGIRSVCHIISIIKYTPQGAYCPEPDRLYNGVEKSLLMATKLNAETIAFSALGTGEGRVKPEDCAKLMIDAVSDFFAKHRKSNLKVIFALPSYRDYKAFENLLTSSTYSSLQFSLEGGF